MSFAARLCVSDRFPGAVAPFAKEYMIRPERRPAIEPEGRLGLIISESKGRARIKVAIASQLNRDIERTEIDRAESGGRRRGKSWAGHARYLTVRAAGGRGCEGLGLALWSRRRRALRRF